MRETHLRPGRQIVKLGLIKIMNDLFPNEKMKIAYSILEGVFCNLIGSDLSIREIKNIKTKLSEWVLKDCDVLFLYKKDGYYHYTVDGMLIKTLYPAYTKTKMAEPFNIIPFSNGFIIDFCDTIEKKETPPIPPLIPPILLAGTYEKTQKWIKNINIETVSDVNCYIKSNKSLKILSMAEALHEKEIADIADMILHRRGLRIILISGPSSSGKTSFTHRISTQLLVNGIRPTSLSLDDYYLNFDKVPIDENGKHDFDSLDALDVELLKNHIERLVNGETVETPIYDFNKRERSPKTKKISVRPLGTLLIEGIHALNPKIIPNIDRNFVFKIYVSVLGGLNIDPTSRLPTTEIRLIRRLVRDDRYRGFSPEDTFNQWDSVRRGEYENIFYFQEEADVMFNSSMLYEMNALRLFAQSSLGKIKDDSQFAKTRDRLLNVLSFFEPMDVSKVPFNSILREFIGGSIYFNYD